MLCKTGCLQDPEEIRGLTQEESRGRKLVVDMVVCCSLRRCRGHDLPLGMFQVTAGTSRSPASPSLADATPVVRPRPIGSSEELLRFWLFLAVLRRRMGTSGVLECAGAGPHRRGEGNPRYGAKHRESLLTRRHPGSLPGLVASWRTLFLSRPAFLKRVHSLTCLH